MTFRHPGRHKTLLNKPGDWGGNLKSAGYWHYANSKAYSNEAGGPRGVSSRVIRARI